MKGKIEETIKRIVGAKKVSVFLFDRDKIFEEEFLEWFLRYAGPIEHKGVC